MKIDRISYQKVFPIAQYVNEKIGVEMQLDEGDDPAAVMLQAKEMVHSWASGHIMDTGEKKYDGPKLSPLIKDEPSQYSAPPKEINLADEKTEIAIDNATTLEELEPLKVKCHTVPMFKRYQEKLNQLKK